MKRSKHFFTGRLSAVALGVVSLASGLVALPAQAQLLNTSAGNLIVSTSTYVDPGFAAGVALPNSAGVTTAASSAFCSNSNCSDNVWNSDLSDANFGITAPIILQSVNATTGAVNNSLNVTALAASQGINLVTSFSSKSELAINLTPDGTGITFMGYDTTSGQFDISNSATPGVAEAGNTDTATPTYRGVAQLSLSTNAMQYTTTNAYSGNNGRAAILGSNGVYYTVGNGGNGNGGTGITNGTGVQIVTPGVNATASTPGTNQVGLYNVTQNGLTADKVAKDNNFRGETVFNNTLYVTKGSGSNGINTVYQVGTAGTLPSGNDSTTLTVLPGFSTTSAKTGAASAIWHPFGIWFANSTTLYVADEGSGASTDFASGSTAATTNAGGLQKWSLVNGSWQMDYMLQGNLIGNSYTVNGTGSLAGDSLTTTTDGLRNMTGVVNANGTVTLYAVTSTEGSVLGDAGADPNQLVSITDTLADTSASQVTNENFNVLETAQLGQVLRGVAAVPEPQSYALIMAGLGMVLVAARRARK